MNYGLLILGEEIVYTAHLQKTATETFEDMEGFFAQPAIKKHVAEIRRAMGREQIVMRNGGRVKFLARTRNGGRGQHGDLLVFDEAQELTPQQQGSFLPSISASPNPQTIYAGTPPDEDADGEVFRRIRQSALDGQTRSTAWAEWSVDAIGDVGDVDRWYATNPSLGLLIAEDTIATEKEQMAPDTFARERLGWWSATTVRIEHLIEVADWKRCQTDHPPKDGTLAVAVKFAGDGSRASLAVALKPENGKPHVEVVASQSTAKGSGWAAKWIEKRKDKIASVIIDGRIGSAALETRLCEAGLPRKLFRLASTKDAIEANSILIDAVRSGEVTHFGQPALDVAATRCAKRRIGNDGVGFADTDEADATLIESCALAYREVMTTKRNPARKLRVSL